ncbi:YlbG family protein [Levilactobacillus bambusae]|uniref:DUF2129 domain-containing protein n=1 Tax=Levilactobacillus bambusae TaxID=2024736 RepID=A0A2V1N0Y0_9LACO|nr:YlbG family protein [Levilactobacillus bambusae]PWG00673.1 DUF2129 domain-containing protein [Levilactobacillus bambusae]
MTFKINPRTELIIYTYSLKQMRQLKRYGNVEYTSKRMRYAVMYVDLAEAEAVTEKLKSLRFVKRVISSPRQDVRETFGDTTGDALLEVDE